VADDAKFITVPMPGTEFVHLERALSAFRVGPEDIVEQVWSVPNTIACAEKNAPEGVWWRLPFRNGEFQYINITEGEFRLAEPPPPAQIRDAPPASGHVTCRDVVVEMSRRCEGVRAPTARHEELAASARRILSGHAGASLAATARFAALVKDARAGLERSEYLKRFNDLYDTCLFTLDMDVSKFDSLIALLQVQTTFGCWLDEEWYDAPYDFLSALYSSVAPDVALRERLIEASAIIANTEYEGGTQQLLAALEGSSMQSYTKKLLLAYHRFSCSLKVQTCAMRIGALSSAFDSPLHVIDEAVACTLSALACGAEFAALPPLEMLRRVGLVYKTSSQMKEAISNYSCPRFPVFPRAFAQILTAYTRCVLDDQHRGIPELAAWEESHGADLDNDYEAAWVENGLLNGYRAIGSDLVWRYAGRITARLTMRAH